MPRDVRLPEIFHPLLRCPVCHAKLELREGRFVCAGAACGAAYPIVDGVPVVLDEASSVFSIDDFVSARTTFFGGGGGSKLREAVRRRIPTGSWNVKARSNYERLNRLLMERSPSPHVLVVGGSILGEGMHAIANNAALRLVESDVTIGPRLTLVSDAHEIPFDDASFDGAIVQAVLEHVLDPYRCCEEIHRVLKPRGLVYAETPFMQQVHGGRYDFTRFTHLGHRRLFRRFEEIDSGAGCGPGMALSWSYRYFLMSFFASRSSRGLAAAFADLTSFWLKYFDRVLTRRDAGLDAASGLYFLGTKSERTLPDRELIALYRGGG